MGYNIPRLRFFPRIFRLGAIAVWSEASVPNSFFFIIAVYIQRERPTVLSQLSDLRVAQTARF